MTPENSCPLHAQMCLGYKSKWSRLFSIYIIRIKIVNEKGVVGSTDKILKLEVNSIGSSYILLPVKNQKKRPF